jgi:hypothetical protein
MGTSWHHVERFSESLLQQAPPGTEVFKKHLRGGGGEWAELTVGLMCGGAAVEVSLLKRQPTCQEALCAAAHAVAAHWDGDATVRVTKVE